MEEMANQELVGAIFREFEANFLGRAGTKAVNAWRESNPGRNPDLSEENFREMNFSGAKLGGANLYKTDLRKAKLGGADLSGADLRKANLEGTNLYRANFEGANLEGANLTEANLWGTSGIPQGVFEEYIKALRESVGLAG